MKVSIEGRRAYFKSDLKLEQLKLVQEHDPDSLVLYDDDIERRKQLLRFAVGNDTGVSTNGIVFSDYGTLDGGYATSEMELPEYTVTDSDSAKKYISSHAPVLANIKALEQKISEKAQEILQSRAELENSIDIN